MKLFAKLQIFCFSLFPCLVIYGCFPICLSLHHYALGGVQWRGF